MSETDPHDNRDPEEQHPDLYKVCGVCGKGFPDRVQYLSETVPVRQNPDFPEGNMPDEEGPGHFFELRNCNCGATLAVRIHTKRDLSPRGLLRREMFDDLEQLFMLRDKVDRREAHGRVMARYGAFFKLHLTNKDEDKDKS